MRLGRTSFLALVFLVLPALAGCRADVRERLAVGLAEVNTRYVELVKAPETTLVPVEAAWLHGWQVLLVQTFTVPNPHYFYAALSDGGTVLVLSNRPDSFAQLTRSAGVRVDNASLAIKVAVLYLDVTRAYRSLPYRVDAIADVQWLPHPDAAEQQQRADLETKYADLVGPPTAEPSGTGWTVTAWRVNNRTLVRHRLTVAANGAVHDSPEVLETEIPAIWIY